MRRRRREVGVFFLCPLRWSGYGVAVINLSVATSAEQSVCCCDMIPAELLQCDYTTKNDAAAHIRICALAGPSRAFSFLSSYLFTFACAALSR